jgi:hypothetical protein
VQHKRSQLHITCSKSARTSAPQWHQHRSWERCKRLGSLHRTTGFSCTSCVLPQHAVRKSMWPWLEAQHSSKCHQFKHGSLPARRQCWAPDWSLKWGR